MERELKKNLMEIEHLIKDHEQRGNTHTQSVLQIACERPYFYTGMMSTEREGG